VPKPALTCKDGAFGAALKAVVCQETWRHTLTFSKKLGNFLAMSRGEELRRKHAGRRRAPVVPVGHVLVDGRPWPVESVLGHVREARAAADALEAAAVAAGREAGLSWDRLSVMLGGRPSGERLRQRYGAAGSSS